MFSLSGLLQYGEIWSHFGARNTPCSYQLVLQSYQSMFTMKTRSGKELREPGFQDVQGPKAEGGEGGELNPANQPKYYPNPIASFSLCGSQSR